MKRSQWFTLAWSCMIIGMIFIGIDLMNNQCLNLMLENPTFEPTSLFNTWCVINSEIYEPFTYLSYMLWIVFLTLGFMEKKK